MAVDDLWFLKKRDPATRKPLPSKRHGRGKRWRVRWVDPETGKPRVELFERKADADRHDSNVHADISRGQYVDPAAGRITVTEYAEQWRRDQLHRTSTVDRVERAIRLHIVPLLGHRQMSEVRPSHMRGWVKDRSQDLAPTSLRGVFHTVLSPMFNAALLDRVIGVNPCTGIQLPEIEGTDYVIATPRQVHDLAGALPAQYRAVPFVVAGCGLRAGEVMGLELDGVEFLPREVHVRHQLMSTVGRKPYLAPPKTKTSKRTVELADVVGTALAEHVRKYLPKPIEIDDETDPRKPVRREAHLLFLTPGGGPFHRNSWSSIWRPAVEKAGLPTGFGLRDLRHYFATCLIFGGANVKTVQLAMGHSRPTVTLDTYVGLWPDALDRTRALVENALALPVDDQSAVTS